jgi:HEAT repeat protein
MTAHVLRGTVVAALAIGVPGAAVAQTPRAVPSVRPPDELTRAVVGLDQQAIEGITTEALDWERQTLTNLERDLANHHDVVFDFDFDFDYRFDFDFDRDFNVGYESGRLLTSIPPLPPILLLPPIPPVPPVAGGRPMTPQPPRPPSPPATPVPEPRPAPEPRGMRRAAPPRPPDSSAADDLYQQATSAIDQGRYERAIERLDRLMSDSSFARIDAALYWKAYSLGRIGQQAEALAALADLQKRYAESRWLKDAKVLEVEIRQAAGQPVSPEAQADEEIRLLALRGLMQADPERAVPMIEQVLGGNSSIKVKENALFVLSQSRSPRARAIITSAARGSVNPDLQLRAVRYLGAVGGPETRQVLDDIYRSTSDTAIKRQIMQSMAANGHMDVITTMARTEKDPSLRRSAIRTLGGLSASRSGATLRSLYGSETDANLKREIISALSRQDNAAALVEIARAEKDPAMRRLVVQRLSTMKSQEATEYLMELLR